MWTKKGLLSRAEAKGKGGGGLEVVIKFEGGGNSGLGLVFE